VPHGAECPERLAVALLLTDGHVVSRHEVPRMALIAHLNVRQPFDVGHAIPTAANDSFREGARRSFRSKEGCAGRAHRRVTCCGGTAR